MHKEDVILCLKCIAKKGYTHLPGILECVPGAGKLLSEVSKIMIEGIEDAQKISEINKKIYNLAINAEKAEEKPEYMSSVVLPCINGELLTEEQQGQIADILSLEVDCDEAGMIETVAGFIGTYMGGDACINEDYEIGDNYINLNFCMETLDYSEEGYDYDERPVQELVTAFNSLLGQKLFKDYVIYG